MQQQQLTGFNGRRIAYYYFFLFLLSWLYLFDQSSDDIGDIGVCQVAYTELLMSQGG
ncbi:hypothetical protein M430DRAFT_37036 [Amorphotheca resinae ATCC 22711]|jgi:hypothetical protein|uniref:Uncharacterized protein n=1 Tax=Amorphotheca resinae ATCC 22711 TaxID=857342 RepID=A0A2T3ATR7_AMORE|nr:hypothetical protein M430DRAFT_37036 [Amorphotheca resinae ATCC 22711]PSS10870.1 hypothetical protein M430DRAFT_37036 [Amorphotheca resinae ATCC 22711]